jgi:pSer/pThr/pTyr-binding forkhead associated (FHA) protein
MAKPISCPRCRRENDPGFAFCLDCGAALRPPPPQGASACATCGAALLPGFRFCGVCGKPVAAPGATPPGGAPPAARPAPPPLPRAAALRLTSLRSDGAPGASFPLDAEEVICGRTDGAIRFPDDPTVSPRHARFTRAGSAVSVEDLGSVNGTFLRLRGPRRLAAGEELRVGRQLLRLEPLPRPGFPDPRTVRAWGTPDAGCRLRLAQLLEDGGVGELFPLCEGANELGREAGDVAFPADRYVSARHATLELRGGEVTVADAGSSNGTFVRLAGRAELAPGDQLLVGGQLLRLDA